MENILDDNQFKHQVSRRRDLLPTWIKVFVWIFMIFGAIVPLMLVVAVLGMQPSLSLYGLETMNPFSLTGIAIIFFFALKGAVAFGLWFEKDWAINLAMLDAIIGILVCILVMAVLPFVNGGNTISFTFRLELLFLIPYLLKMRSIKQEWE